MKKLKQLIKNLRFLSKVDLESKQVVAEEVRDFLTDPNRSRKAAMIRYYTSKR